MRFPLISLVVLLAVSNVGAAGNDAPGLSAKELAARLSSVQEGSANVRLKMALRDSADAEPKTVLQLQIKQRRTAEATDLVYRVLFPRERMGEAVLLHQSAGHAPTGWLLVPPNKPQALNAAQMSEPLFGSSLSYEDAVENVFAWKNQTLAGNETIDRADCVILESKPGEGDHSAYARARSWVDTKRLVPLRVEKYGSGGRLLRRIDTTRVASDDQGHPVPANLTVRGEREGAVTELDGSRITHDVTFTDREFTPEGMAETLK